MATQVARGLTNKVIAHNLKISESCVKKHVTHAFAKLNVQNRTQLALWASDHG